MGYRKALNRNGFRSLPKRVDAVAYLRATKILRSPPKRCNFGSMPRPKARDSAEAICESTNRCTEKYFSPGIDRRIDRQMRRQEMTVSK
jgi:hypothetical protein